MRTIWIVINFALRVAVAAIYGRIIWDYLPETIRAVRLGYPGVLWGLLIHFPVHLIGGLAILWSARRLAQGKGHDSAGMWTAIIVASLLIAGPLTGFFSLVKKSFEGETKATLFALREAKFLKKEAPAASRTAKIPYFHKPSSDVRYGAVADDSGGWMYDNVAGDKRFGEIRVNCTHTDSKGTAWSSC